MPNQSKSQASYCLFVLDDYDHKPMLSKRKTMLLLINALQKLGMAH